MISGKKEYICDKTNNVIIFMYPSRAKYFLATKHLYSFSRYLKLI
jgi:hypothetical protein